MLNDCNIDPNEQIGKPPVALSLGVYADFDGEMHPLPLVTYGNFIFIQAPPKHSKTFLVSLLAAAFLGGKKEFTGYIDSHRGGKDVLHVDTEQSKWHAQKVFQRVGRMVENKESLKSYKTLALREYKHYDRIDFIEAYLNFNENVGLVIIDGVADLVAEVNDQKESNALAQRIMTMSSKYNCAIVTVIHSNYGSEKPTGHLGSALEKKAETQIIIEKNSQAGGMLAKCRRSRNKAFDPISFIIEKGMPRIQKKIQIEW